MKEGRVMKQGGIGSSAKHPFDSTQHDLNSEQQTRCDGVRNVAQLQCDERKLHGYRDQANGGAEGSSD